MNEKINQILRNQNQLMRVSILILKIKDERIFTPQIMALEHNQSKTLNLLNPIAQKKIAEKTLAVQEGLVGCGNPVFKDNINPEGQRDDMTCGTLFNKKYHFCEECQAKQDALNVAGEKA